jgi:formate dehydrogenase subunit delta
MDIDHLVKMANEIGEFFDHAGDSQEAVTSIAAHLKNFWEPRMRRQLLEHAKRGGSGLSGHVRTAVLSLDTAKTA